MDEEKTRIFCVEDDHEMIELLRLVLERRGFAFAAAATGAEGLDAIRLQKPDLILLDLMMPEMDGWEVFRRLKQDETTRDIPVVVVTAKAQTIDRVLGLHIARVDDYVTKPFSPMDLVGRIEQVLERRRQGSEANGHPA